MSTINARITPTNVSALTDQGREVSRSKTDATPTAAPQSVFQSPARSATAAADWSPENNWLSRIAEDPAAAHRLAKDYAYSDDRALLDITDWCAGTGPQRYVATGQPVTEGSEKEFRAMAATLKEGRIQPYESEKAKGTSDVEILNKIRSFMDQNAPADYLKQMDWERISGRSTKLTVFA